MVSETSVLPAGTDRPIIEPPPAVPSGLTDDEVKERLLACGPNSVERLSSASSVTRFTENFTHLMALLLWLSGVLAFVAGVPQLGLAIWAVNIINGVFSFVQEFKAEKATEALMKLLPLTAHVMRNGGEATINASELVPGDLIFLAEGDNVPADCRLVAASMFAVDESMLTGESRPLRKTAASEENAAHDDKNFLFAGTNVSSGTASAVVVATGTRTRFGKIALLTRSIAEAPSPLQKEMARVTRSISLVATAFGVLFYALAIGVAHADPVTSFVFALGMIVAFVPEGMLPTVSLSLAMGVERMSRSNALIKRLSAVETLGCTTVICTDKTGTVTANQMTVQNIWTFQDTYRVSGSGYCPDGDIRSSDSGRLEKSGVTNDMALARSLLVAKRCNDARLLPPSKSREWSVIGDPTEGALLVAARKFGIGVEDGDGYAHKICDIPFDSRRKSMSSIYETVTGREVYVKGSTDRVLAMCTKKHVGEETEHKLEMADIEAVIAANDRYAEQGLRVLALAGRTLPRSICLSDHEEVEQDLTFYALIAMFDPPHVGVVEAVRKCHNAGIKTVMITGDHGLTAKTIARQTGIVQDPCDVVTGEDLDGWTDDTLKRHLSGDVIFARILPEQKLRIVEAFQQSGHVVAMTGDGVNDAPALRKADIGIAMGIAGSDVARESADMILTDNNFASIVSAIELGRAVYANIRKFAIYVLTSNMAEAVPFAVSLFSHGLIPLPLTVMQVLSIDLGTDMVPALGLGMEKAEPGIMDVPPRNLQAPLLSFRLLGLALLWYGLIEAAAGMSCYFFANFQNGWPTIPLAEVGSSAYRQATTMTVIGIVAGQVGAVLCCRTDRTSIFNMDFFGNRLILFGIATELILVLCMMYCPFLQDCFGMAPVGWKDWIFALSWIPVVIVLDEIRKLLLRAYKTTTQYPKIQ